MAHSHFILKKMANHTRHHQDARCMHLGSQAKKNYTYYSSRTLSHPKCGRNSRVGQEFCTSTEAQWKGWVLAQPSKIK